ncbi:MAG: tetratricopeptide repeat protein [Myxococcota bacterium]
MRLPIVMLVVAGLLVAPPAYAQSPAHRDHAVELNDAGERLFEAGKYAEAAEHFRRGYALEPNPTFLYNLALTYEKAEDYARALDALKRYRAAEPNAPDIVAIDARIETLTKLLAQIDERRPPKPEVLVEVRESPSLLEGPLPWVIAGLGGAGLGVGAILGGVGLARHDRAVAEPVHETALELQNEATTFGTASTVSLIAGGTLLAVGVTLGVVGQIDAADGTASTEVALQLSARRLGLRVRF